LIFAEIMPEPEKFAPTRRSEAACEDLGQICGSLKVLAEGLPLGGVTGISGVSEILHRSLVSLLIAPF
jgi:hypothetical protein